jgi:hypothetical protein
MMADSLLARSAVKWIRRTTIGCVAKLALIGGTISYLHMHLLVDLHGQPGWVAGAAGEHDLRTS